MIQAGKTIGYAFFYLTFFFSSWFSFSLYIDEGILYPSDKIIKMDNLIKLIAFLAKEFHVNELSKNSESNEEFLVIISYPPYDRRGEFANVYGTVILKFSCPTSNIPGWAWRLGLQRQMRRSGEGRWWLGISHCPRQTGKAVSDLRLQPTMLK